MSLGELIDQVMKLLDVDAPTAVNVAQTIYSDDRPYTDNEIRYAAVKLGAVPDVPASGEEAVAKEHGEMTVDPAEVLAEVYKRMPRVMRDDMPRIGRRPKDVELPDQVEQMIADLPEEVRLCVLDIDVFSGQATFILYDEANDVDCPIGPIDLTRYEDIDSINTALTTLLKRLPKVLAADFN